MTDYNKCFVAYLDILKFSYLVERMEAEPIDFLLDEMKRNVSMFCPEHQLTIKWMFISDSLVLYTVDDTKESFEYLIGTIVQLILCGISVQFPIRGAIAYGNFYFNNLNNMFFGPALVDAVKYEKKQNWMGAMLTPTCSEFAASNNFNTSSQLIQYDVPLREHLEKIDNTCELTDKTESALCVNWTKGFFYDSNATGDKIGRVLLEGLFSWPHRTSKLSGKNILKLENTYSFLRYCKQLENGI